MDEMNDIFDMGEDISEESANIQEVAEPDLEEGANEQEIAEPAVQPVEERAQFAAARREAERQRDIAIARAKSDADEYIQNALGDLGLVNPYTNTPIRTREELDAYRDRHSKEAENEVYSRLGVSQSDMSRVVSNSPEIREMREFFNAAKRQEDERVIRAEIEEINRLNPNANFKDVADILNSDIGPEFRKNVEAGNNFLNAYKLADMSRLMERERAAGRQQALNGVNGKNHLAATAVQGVGSVPVPADVAEMYRGMIPGITDAEIRKEYNKQLKGR